MIKDLKKIVFFNSCHSGDLHVSRSFVRHIVESVPAKIECCYTHNNDSSILCDIPKLKYIKGPLKFRRRNDSEFELIGSIAYVNTWYRAGGLKYQKYGSTTFGNLHALFLEHCNRLGVSIDNEDPAKFLPAIDFSHYKLSKANRFLDAHKGRKKLLFCNGQAKSGQAKNFNMLPRIKVLAQRHPEIDFIYTNGEKVECAPLPSNVYGSRKIIGSNKCDLNENGYLSTHCDAIIGRFSGAFTFSMIQDNFNRKVPFITFSRVKYPTWLNEKYAKLVPLKCSFNQYKEVSKFDNVIEQLIKRI